MNFKEASKFSGPELLYSIEYLGNNMQMRKIYKVDLEEISENVEILAYSFQQRFVRLS